VPVLICAMDPTKIRMRYLLGIFVMAVATAAVLRRFLHVEAGFTRKEILVGALITAAIGIILAVVFFRRRPRP
jgi:formate-dependent nitrite reductase membrane component NrfD